MHWVFENKLYLLSLTTLFFFLQFLFCIGATQINCLWPQLDMADTVPEILLSISSSPGCYFTHNRLQWILDITLYKGILRPIRNNEAEKKIAITSFHWGTLSLCPACCSKSQLYN